MAKKWYQMFPHFDYQNLNLDFIFEHFGDFDGRLEAVEASDKRQDQRLDEDEADIAALQTGLADETTARIAGDNGLSERITAEVAARIAADSTLQSNIDVETSARQQADEGLSDAISSVVSSMNTTIIGSTTPVIIPYSGFTQAEVEAAYNDYRDNIFLQLNSGLLIRLAKKGTNKMVFEDVYPLNGSTHLILYSWTFEKISETWTVTASGGSFTNVLANPSDANPIGDLVNLRVAGVDYSIPTGGGSGSNVVANDTTGTTGGDLTALKVDGVSYTVPSGGTTVIANPSGTATADLTKIGIGANIYSIPSYDDTNIQNDITDIQSDITNIQNNITNIGTTIGRTSMFSTALPTWDNNNVTISDNSITLTPGTYLLHHKAQSTLESSSSFTAHLGAQITADGNILNMGSVDTGAGAGVYYSSRYIMELEKDGICFLNVAANTVIRTRFNYQVDSGSPSPTGTYSYLEVCRII